MTAPEKTQSSEAKHNFDINESKGNDHITYAAALGAGGATIGTLFYGLISFTTFNLTAMAAAPFMAMATLRTRQAFYQRENYDREHNIDIGELETGQSSLGELGEKTPYQKKAAGADKNALTGTLCAAFGAATLLAGAIGGGVLTAGFAAASCVFFGKAIYQYKEAISERNRMYNKHKIKIGPPEADDDGTFDNDHFDAPKASGMAP